MLKPKTLPFSRARTEVPPTSQFSLHFKYVTENLSFAPDKSIVVNYIAVWDHCMSGHNILNADTEVSSSFLDVTVA